MRKYFDFYVYFDPKKESITDLTIKIIDDIINGRLRENKPVIMYYGGDSGEGKSYSVLKIQEVLLALKNLSAAQFCRDINVTTPAQYREKLNSILFEESHKEINMIAMHEAREVVNAKLWRGFVSQAVAHVNAMSRSIKPLCIMIVSQFIRDITTDIRYTLTYYCIAHRPRGQNTRLEIFTIYKDDSDLEKPKIKKRRMCGYIVYPNGRKRFYQPRYLTLTLPSVEMRNIFDDMDTKSKAEIIKRKLDKLMKEINEDMGIVSNKVDAMVEFYSKNTDSLAMIGHRVKDKWVLSKKVKEMHELKDYEIKEFQKKLNEAFKKKVNFDGEVVTDGMEIADSGGRADGADG